MVHDVPLLISSIDSLFFFYTTGQVLSHLGIAFEVRFDLDGCKEQKGFVRIINDWDKETTGSVYINIFEE